MKQVNREDLLNGWLKYWNTTVEEVVKRHPKEFLRDSDWFRAYAVTQEQHDEWEKWAKEHVRKTTKLPKRFIDKIWGFTYLDVVPDIIYTKNEE